MSEKQIDYMKKYITDNSLVFVMGVVLACLGWANRQQLSEISLKQDNAILQIQKTDGETYVTKQWFMQATADQKEATAATTLAVGKVAEDISEIKTSVAVLKSEVETSNTKKP